MKWNKKILFPTYPAGLFLVGRQDISTWITDKPLYIYTYTYTYDAWKQIGTIHAIEMYMHVSRV